MKVVKESSFKVAKPLIDYHVRSARQREPKHLLSEAWGHLGSRKIVQELIWPKKLLFPSLEQLTGFPGGRQRYLKDQLLQTTAASSLRRQSIVNSRLLSTLDHGCELEVGIY